jgi:heme O synthase-like polyprenyltransferase
MIGSRTATIALEKVSVRQRGLDYLALAKPRVVVMVLAVTMAGFYMGTAWPWQPAGRWP